MAKELNPERIDAENPELTDASVARARPASEVLPELFSAETSNELLAPKSHRGPQKSPTKERITIRLSPAVADYFRSQGAGWQGKIDEILMNYVEHHQ